MAKSQGITKPDPNRPRPTVDKTFALFGLKGGAPQDAVEATLRENGYPSQDCKYDSEGLENKCDTASGNYRFSLSFFHGRLESFTFQFPISQWEQQVQFFRSNLGDPSDTDKRTGAAAISWQSEQTTPCAPPNEEGKQCPAESLILSTRNEDATASAVYIYIPLVNRLIVERALRMMGGQIPKPNSSSTTAAEVAPTAAPLGGSRDSARTVAAVSCKWRRRSARG